MKSNMENRAKRLTEEAYMDITELFGTAAANRRLDEDLARDRQALRHARILGGTADLEDWTISLCGYRFSSLECRENAHPFIVTKDAAGGLRAIGKLGSGLRFHRRLPDGDGGWAWEVTDERGMDFGQLGTSPDGTVTWVSDTGVTPLVGFQLIEAVPDTRKAPLPRTGYAYYSAAA